MFGSTILDVAAGIIFGFLAISLFTSASVEAINSALNVRVKNLRTGIMALVNDPNFTGLAKELYQHALDQPARPGRRGSGEERSRLYRKDAVCRGLARRSRASPPQRRRPPRRRPAPEAVAALKARMASQRQVAKISDPQIKQLLQGMVDRAAGDMSRLKSASRQLVRQWDGSSQRRLQAAHASHDLRHRPRDRVCQSIWTPFGSALSLWGQPALAEELKSIHDSTVCAERPSMGRLASGQAGARPRSDSHGAGRLPRGMGARAFLGHPGRSGTLGSDLGRASFDLVPPAPGLAHHRCGRAVRRALLVRRAPIDRSSQGRGPEPR